MKPKITPGEALGLKLLQSMREMKAGKAARVTRVELTEVAEARQVTFSFSSRDAPIGRKMSYRRCMGLTRAGIFMESPHR